MTSKRTEDKRPEWKKVLYLKQNFEDNYVDKSFLKELRKNEKVDIIPIKYAVYGSFAVTQQICNTVLFALLYFSLEAKLLDASFLLVVTVILTLFGYVIFKIITFVQTSNASHRSIAQDFRSVFIFICCSYGVSPILKTLTSTISTDTVYATASLMFIIHLMFHNYGLESSFVSGEVSLNAAIFGGITLASRLQNVFEVFTLVTLNISLFGLIPTLRNTLLALKLRTMLCLLFALSALATILLAYFICSTVMIPMVIMFGFINIVCPLWFVSLQKYKENIHGPWDEAVINDADKNTELHLQVDKQVQDISAKKCI